MCGSTQSAWPHEKAIPERYRMSIGCSSRSLVSLPARSLSHSLPFSFSRPSSLPLLFTLRSFSLSLLPASPSFSIRLLTRLLRLPDHPLSHPPVARFTRGPDFVFYLFSTTTLWSPLVSRVLWSTISVSLSRVVPSGGLCFPGVLSIDYGTTIDLPDSAGDRRWERHIGIQREKMVDRE